MTIKDTNMTNVFLIKENIFEDERGRFLRIWDEITYSDKKMIINSPQNTDESLIQTYFVQDNVSYSKKGVFRGLHYQVGDWSQAKLVRVLKGRVIDFIVDLREDSETFGKFEFFDLNDRDGHSLFIPPYFAHGFLSLQDDTIFHYKCGNLYKKENEGSVTPFDNIIRHVSDNKSTIKDIVDMYLVDVEPLLSEKDLDSPKFMDRRIN
jgi:dTDP-4-dehydrorhamnose 3,5-epimerase